MLAQSLLSHPDWIHICSDPLGSASHVLGIAKHMASTIAIVGKKISRSGSVS